MEKNAVITEEEKIRKWQMWVHAEALIENYSPTKWKWRTAK